MISSEPIQIEPLYDPKINPDQALMMTDSLETELLSWKDTPYRQEVQIKQRGVDCVRFVSAIYDWLTGVKTDIHTLPPDAALHNRNSAVASMRKLLRLYDSEIVEGRVVQPGDLLICGPVNGGPGHGVIAGQKNLWHCGLHKVCRRGLSFGVHGNNVLREIRRLKNRDLWLCLHDIS